VLADLSPGLNQSSGLIGLELDRAAGKLYFTDELANVVRRCNLDGSNLEVIYTSPSDLSPTVLVLDQDPLQEIQDCNGNEVRDLDDITNGTSADCNENGIPDECEDSPCETVDYFLDHGSDPAASGRTVSGDPNSGFEVFQPFSFASIPEAPPVVLVEIGLDGYAVNYHPAGFTATLFPDDGTGTFPDESVPLAEAVLQYRFGVDATAWEYRPFDAVIGPGQYWVRLRANDPGYYGVAHVGTSGDPSVSRRIRDGAIFPSSFSIAMRLRSTSPSSVPDLEEVWNARLTPRPNPSSGEVRVTYRVPGAVAFEVSILDPAGRLVRRLERGTGSGSPERESSSVWDGLDEHGRVCTAGSYFARIRLGDGQAASQKLVRIR
jgi:hypothetical protein